MLPGAEWQAVCMSIEMEVARRVINELVRSKDTIAFLFLSERHVPLELHIPD